MKNPLRISIVSALVAPAMCLAAESAAPTRVVITPNPLPPLQVTRPANAPALFDPTKGHTAADAAQRQAAGNANAGAKAKGPAVDPSGVWKWTTLNRNGQPIEKVLKVDVAKKGEITGTLTDNFGEHPISNPSIANGALTFTVRYHSPGRGDVPFTYTVNLDSNDLRVAVDRPDFSPAGKAAGKMRHTEQVATHAPKS